MSEIIADMFNVIGLGINRVGDANIPEHRVSLPVRVVRVITRLYLYGSRPLLLQKDSFNHQYGS